MMIQDNLHVLDLLMLDQQAQTGVFRPGEYWKPYTERINYYIRKDGLASFRAHEGIGKGYTDTVTKDPFVSLPLKSKTQMLRRFVRYIPLVDHYIIGQYNELIEKYLRRVTELEGKYLLAENQNLIQKYEDVLSTIDSIAGDAQQYIDYKGQKIAFSYVEVLKRIENVSAAVDLSSKSSFMEVGGGFGANTHTMLTMFPNIKTCIYVDLPPMLHVSTEYLRHHFGDRLMDYAEFKKQKDAGKVDIEGRLLCIPPWALEGLSQPIDLFWNSCSFQEMDSGQISYYGRWVAANAVQGKADILAVFYPFDTDERSEKRSLELLSAEGMEFKTLPDKDKLCADDLIYGVGQPTG
ncbi:MAG: putative sugar O-methyltransferase [Rhodospirillales bacterium]|nr:putative sugar O-methyltransferase [Rhodospirillales bacterium]MCB9995390.1 putative sugar O-methyltransferase [Rhodospirillales bacterium]